MIVWRILFQEFEVIVSTAPNCSVYFDIVVPVGLAQVNISIKTIGSLLSLYRGHRLFIMTKSMIFNYLRSYLDSSDIFFIDEALVIKDWSIENNKEYFLGRVNDVSRSMWYYQQFLKVAAAFIDYISDNYLIWDADSVCLRELSFFDSQGKIKMAYTSEYHHPYFRTIYNVLSVGKVVSASFISEHMLIKKAYMKEMVKDISASQVTMPWPKIILENISNVDLIGSGFSEYETYGTYLASKYPDSFVMRKLFTLRTGSKLLGHNPTKLQLLICRFFGLDYISFEQGPSPSALSYALVKIRSKFNSIRISLRASISSIASFSKFD